MGNGNGDGTSKKVVRKPKEHPDAATEDFYSKLPPPVANFLAKTADLIRERMNHTLIETGTNLLAAKKKAGYGPFTKWLKVAFGMTERTAQRYMRAARFAAKTDTVSDLPPTALYALSAPTTPPSARIKVLERLREGEKPKASAILALIREEKRNAAGGPTSGGAKRDKPPGHVTTTRRKLDINCLPKIERIIRKRLPPANRRFFWARISNRGGALVISRLRPGTSHGRSK